MLQDTHKVVKTAMTFTQKTGGFLQPPAELQFASLDATLL
jgi:hypothetical protein